MGGLRQAPLRRTEGRPRLSLALHPSRRHLEFASDPVRRQGRHLPLEGLSRPRQGARQSLDQADDAGGRRVHPPLSAARAAERLPPHPPLRPVRQRRSSLQHSDAMVSVRKKEGAEALSAIEVAKNLAPSFAEVYRIEAWAHYFDGNYAAAKQAYETALELEPKSPS